MNSEINAKKINTDFAITLLKSMYKLDIPIGEISKICDQLQDVELKNKLILAVGDLLAIISDELMFPIYDQHPSLGKISDPGPQLV